MLGGGGVSSCSKREGVGGRGHTRLVVLSKATRVPTRLRPSVVMMHTFSVWRGGGVSWAGIMGVGERGEWRGEGRVLFA